MNNNPIKILVTGDFCPINRIEELAKEKDYKSIFNDFIDVFRKNDLNVIDLECPLTKSNHARAKTGPHQKAHPDNINILKYANISLAAIANNHIMDYGSNGVIETLKLCRDNDIDTVGIGSSAEEAAIPFSRKIRDKHIAILNFADNEFISAPDRLFECNPFDPIGCFNDISKARLTHNFVIVIIHAGNEFYELPSPRTKKLYRGLIDMGADAVISHHTHAFSGYELYHSKPIFYGLGNFIYDWPGKSYSSWNKGYMVKLLLSDEVNFEIIPLKHNNEKPGVFQLDKEEKIAFSNELHQLNLIIEDDQLLESRFLDYCQSVFPMYDAFLEPYFGKLITALRKRNLFPRLISTRKRRLYLNLIRCESHRDVLLRLLQKIE